MREILFRGKRVDNGEWIEGGYAENGGKTFIIVRTRYIPDTRDWDTVEYYENNPCYHLSMIEVDPETVCQYTGLTDKNGRKIFEGYIVQDAEFSFEGYEPYIKGIVKFRTGTFDSGCYEYNGWVIEEKDGNIDHTPLLQYEKEKGYLCDSGFEVIGNIFDNPELIGEQP